MENNYILNRALIFIALSFLLVACSTDANIQPTVSEVEEAIEDKEIEHNTIETDIHIVKTIDDQIIFFEKEFANRIPSLWGENIDGVITRVNTRDKVVALTFDACGSNSDGYDEDIISFLIDNNIPATLFINARWIDKFPEEFAKLADNPLFEIANHGFHHKPLSVIGQSAYGIDGTESIKEVVEEILLNDKKIFEITGKRPRYFRSGTAYYDDLAVEIANKLGYNVVNYSVLGDAGASFTKEQIIKSLNSANPGSIILFHMNRPEKNIAPGIIEGITNLQEKGYSFVLLSQYHNLLE